VFGWLWIVSMNGYRIDVYTFKASTGDVLSRLQKVRDIDNLHCGTNADTDTLTTYNTLPAIISDTSGTDSIESAPCHFFATTVQKGNEIYEISATEIDTSTNQEHATATGYQIFLASFKFTN
jgi:hypothetical protein